MDFDSDEQRKAVFASMRERERFRYRHRKSNTISKIQIVDLQIENLKYQRNELKTKIDAGEKKHEPFLALKIKKEELDKIDAEIRKLEFKKQRLNY